MCCIEFCWLEKVFSKRPPLAQVVASSFEHPGVGETIRVLLHLQVCVKLPVLSALIYLFVQMTFIFSVCVFVIGGGVCALSHSYWLLLLMRFFTAIGGNGIFQCCFIMGKTFVFVHCN